MRVDKALRKCGQTMRKEELRARELRTFSITLLHGARGRSGVGAPVWRLSHLASPIAAGLFCATDLRGLAVLLGRWGGRTQNHAIGLRPHMSIPDANEGSNCNDNKRQRYCMPHSKFSLCDLGSLGPSPNGEDQEMCGFAPVFTAAHYLYYRQGEPPSPSHLRPFRECSRYFRVTRLCYPRRAKVPGLPICTIRCERMDEELFSYRLWLARVAAFAGIHRERRQSNGRGGN